MPALGIDIGGTSVKTAWVDGDVVLPGRSYTYQQPSRDELTLAVRDAVEMLGESSDVEPPVGLCLPGRQNEAGTCVVESVNLPCLEDWAFEPLLGECLGRVPGRFRVVRDIHATGVDLIRKNGLSGRAAIMAIGTGVGVMVFDSGEPIEIESFKGFGQQVVFGGEVLEAQIGIGALRQAAGTDDEQAIEAYIRSCPIDSAFRQALSESIQILDHKAKPDMIVLAGGIGIALQARAAEIDGLVSCQLMFGDSLYHAASGAARLVLD